MHTPRHTSQHTPTLSPLRAPRAIVTWGLASAMVMSGCSTSPLVSWTAPEMAADGGVSLGQAKAYARSARASYQKSLEDQVSKQSNLAAGLLGLGVLSTAAALAKSHRDVFSSFAFAGGTGYAFGQQNLRPERMRLMVVGIEALNCALAVVTPLDISDRDLAALSEGMAKLNVALASQQTAIGRARDAIASVTDVPNKTARQVVWDARLTIAEDLQRAGVATQSAARNLRGKAQLAGRQLVNTVDRVRTQVDKAALETMPDLSAVTASVASLGDFAGRFAPGAKLDARIKAAVEARGTAQAAVTRSTAGGPQASSISPQALSPMQLQVNNELSAVRAALVQLDAADGALQAAASAVTDDLTGLDPAANTSALSECKAAGVSAPLAVTDDELPFAGSKEETLSFIVSGGVKPYSGVLMTGGSSGVTLRAPAAFDTRFDVTVAATVKSGSFNLLVQDSSTPTPKSQTVKVVVGKAAPATGAGTANTGGATGNWHDALVAAFKNDLSFSTANGHAYTVASRDPKDAALTVTLKCTAKTGAALDTQADVIDAMVSKAGTKEAVITAIGDGKKLLVTAPPACMKPAA